jgi:hypothetical protein
MIERVLRIPANLESNSLPGSEKVLAAEKFTTFSPDRYRLFLAMLSKVPFAG